MRLFRPLFKHGILAVVFALATAAASAQSLPALPKATPGAGGIFGLRQEGLFVTAPLTVDGAPVFRIAAPAVTTGGELPIDVRLLFVQNAITQILSEKEGRGTVYEPGSLKISVDRVGAQQTLVATDAAHANEVPILTITSADAQFARLSDDALAEQWRPLLQAALVTALDKRQPAVIRNNLDKLVRAAAILIASTVLGFFLWTLLRRRIVTLKRRLAERKEQADREGSQSAQSAQTTQRRRVLALALRAAGPDQELQRVRALAGFIVWSLILAWAATTTWALLLFPQTTAVGQVILHTAASIAFIWIAAGLINKIADLIIVRFADVYAQGGVTSESRA
ncbi:MAG: hypothetical protein M3N13_08950, partial [Candidatus Eremiobacteraeota bacterium]|nr:hypothetical protein [Candidatus Eremiobacteraeota bacterium]